MTAQSEPIIRRGPGDLILSEDWNEVQVRLLQEIHNLREHLESLSESIVLHRLTSPVGGEANLHESLEGERPYIREGEGEMGLITKQWVPLVKGMSDQKVCCFGVLVPFDELYYWAGVHIRNSASRNYEESPGERTLDINFDYVNGESEVVGRNLFINNRIGLFPKDSENPWNLLMRSPENLTWYRYKIRNPRPDLEVKNVTFVNTNADCTPRIANVILLRAKLQPWNP